MAKDDKEKAEISEENAAERTAEALGIKGSKVTMTSFKDKNPQKIITEEARHKKLAAKRLEIRIAKAKADAKATPIEKRRAVICARFRAEKSRTREHTYTDANLKAWIEELNMIDRNPKSWIKATKNGTVGYTPSNKKKKTARAILDEMDLDSD